MQKLKVLARQERRGISTLKERIRKVQSRTLLNYITPICYRCTWLSSTHLPSNPSQIKTDTASSLPHCHTIDLILKWGRMVLPSQFWPFKYTTTSYIKEVMYNLLIQHKCYYITETKIQTTWFGFLLNPSEHKTPFLNVSIIIIYFCCIEVLHGLAIGVPCEQTILNVDQRYPISKQEARKTTQQARPTSSRFMSSRVISIHILKWWELMDTPWGECNPPT